ncbi:hypothetical protein RCL_jg2554.t1 [Rhizophagus clarus]|uniref:Uncharacterized protein n=1 Tax=Rhizophagus clarus TaxID=94130 RepID=A0A8H3LKM6_9GLOM|nr:hypothetical protein RCL_jg2554.t1 [Rhizophagus clarus]
MRIQKQTNKQDNSSENVSYMQEYHLKFAREVSIKGQTYLLGTFGTKEKFEESRTSRSPEDWYRLTKKDEAAAKMRQSPSGINIEYDKINKECTA